MDGHAYSKLAVLVPSRKPLAPPAKSGQGADNNRWLIPHRQISGIMEGNRQETEIAP